MSILFVRGYLKFYLCGRKFTLLPVANSWGQVEVSTNALVTGY